MNGYSSHTFKFVNSEEKVFLCKMHFKTNQGNKSLNGAKAKQLASEDPDYSTRDLYNAIAKGNFPSWSFYVQLMPEEEAKDYRFNVYDVTKVWPHSDYPLIPVGQLVLNKNPENYFAEVEQAAFSPAHLIPGIEPSEDKMLQGRLFSYTDTHRHRLGGNYEQIPVNRPRNALRNNYLNRDGFMSVMGNYGGHVNYEPNSFGTPIQNKNFAQSRKTMTGLAARHLQAHPNDDYFQAGELYRTIKRLNPKNADDLISNIVGHLKNASKFIQERQVQIFYKADPEYGTRICDGLQLDKSVLI
nr:catalase HPII [Nephromyces sp. MMRI]